MNVSIILTGLFVPLILNPNTLDFYIGFDDNTI
jgi:hypothetical protein